MYSSNMITMVASIRNLRSYLELNWDVEKISEASLFFKRASLFCQRQLKDEFRNW